MNKVEYILCTYMSHFIYLLWPREFATHNEATYKLGKTTRDPHKRLAEYAKGSEIILVVNVDDCHAMESSLIKIFDELFVKRTKIGNEYYSGDVARMRHEIFTAVMRCDVVKQCLKQKEIIKNNIELLEEECLDAKQSTPKLLKELIPLTNSDDNSDKSDNDSNDESVESYKLQKCEKLDKTIYKDDVICVNTMDTVNVNSKNKKLKDFYKHIYTTKPSWYQEGKLVDIQVIERAYRDFFDDQQIRTAFISRNLKGSLFLTGSRINAVTKKKLIKYVDLKKLF